MSAHTCTTLTDGCYRCDLNKDEIRDYLYSLKVTGSGVVHEDWCSFVSGPSSSAVGWLGSGKQTGDRPCSRCMPDGLPDLAVIA